MNALTAMPRAEPGWAGAVRAVSALIRRTAMPPLLLTGDLTYGAETFRAARSQA